MLLAADSYVQLTRAIGLLEELNSRDAELAAEPRPTTTSSGTRTVARRWIRIGSSC